MLDALDLLRERGSADLEHDVRFGEQVFARRERGAGLLVIFVQKLGVRPGVVFDEHLRETFLAEEGDVLWRERDAAFVREDFSRNSHPQGRVWDALKCDEVLRRVDSISARDRVFFDVKTTYWSLPLPMEMFLPLNAHVWTHGENDE